MPVLTPETQTEGVKQHGNSVNTQAIGAWEKPILEGEVNSLGKVFKVLWHSERIYLRLFQELCKHLTFMKNFKFKNMYFKLLFLII